MKRLAIALCLASAALAFGDRNLRINEASAPANGALLKFDSTNWRGITTTASDIDALLVSGQSFGNLTLADGSITDASGAISFGDENLSTTGTFTVGDALTVGTLLMADATSATIATGTLTVTQSAHTVLGEGAASDDLDTIAGLTATDTWLVLRPGDAAQDITIKHGTGNIVTSDGADYDIPDNGFVLMIYDGSNWRLLSAGGGSATPTYCVAFTIPDEPDDDAQHYQIEIDDTADFSSVIIDHDSRDVGDGGDGQTGCAYFSGTQWAAWTSGTGVTAAYEGERAGYSFSSASISRGTLYYVRIRFHDGTAWGDYAGELKTW